MTAFTEPERMTLEFYLTQKEVINSNMTFKHFMQKAVMVDNLRSKSAEMGALRHPQSELVCKHLEDLDTERKNAAAKNRLMKSLKKDSDITQEEIDREVTLLESTMDAEPSLTPKERSSIQPMFSHFGVNVTVCPPTRRRLDPPNLYPTIKALIDGLTDACWWSDDDFTHLLYTSFRYGGLSGEKGVWKIALDVVRVDDSELGDYITSPD